MQSGTWLDNLILIIRDSHGMFMEMVDAQQMALLPDHYKIGYQLPESAWHGEQEGDCHSCLSVFN
ncbi:hypothetical protein CI610_00496 [invertebrate metagenome]|uniref:Uncharacterized protein n=1 Tax=invertebrate metagenome TaxID=1711999 RepID=A0A2H9TBM8_9ZZZZ